MILQTLLFVLLRYKMSVWELLNIKSCCEYRKKGLFVHYFATILSQYLSMGCQTCNRVLSSNECR